MRPFAALFVITLLAVSSAAGAQGQSAPAVPKPGQAPAAAAPQKPASPGPKKPASSGSQKPASPAGQAAAPAGVTPPPDYVIGADDVLMVIYWREKEMSAEVAVRPDGNITLPLLNEVKAAGLTPEQLRQQVEKAAAEFVEEPSVTVVVKQINSRRVFVTGNVLKAGVYPLTTSMTVLQAIAAAGGLNEYADEKGIAVMRVEGGQTTRFKFNYKDVRRGKKLEQNIVLRPGDTIVVP